MIVERDLFAFVSNQLQAYAASSSQPAEMEVFTMNGSLPTPAPPQCPVSLNCPSSQVSIENGPIPSYVAIVSSGFSCLGSILIVVTFFALKDMRSGAQKIITFLAIADFISAAGYIVGSSNFLTHFNKTDSKDCQVFQDICVAQATFTSWSSLVSFLWTAILAFYFYLIIVYRRVQVAARLMPLYHIVAWGLPLFIVVPLVATSHLGYAPYAASNWCFVKDNDYAQKGLKNDPVEIIIILLNGKLWEILTYVIVTVLFILISAHVAKTRKQMRDTILEPRMVQIESRLLAIPIIFVLLRMWGTIQFFFSLAVADYIVDGCVPNNIHIAFLVLGVLQAIGDGGQGWGNAILYVFLSPTIREKLCNTLCGNCMDALEGRLGILLESEASRSGVRHIQNEVSENGAKKRGGVLKGNGKPALSDATPLIAATPATGYGVKEYDTTTSGTHMDSCNYDMVSSTAA